MLAEAVAPDPGQWLSAQCIPWVVLLATTILLTLLGILAPTLLAQIQKRRCHNHEKVWNECLAGHQLAYVSFYTAVIAAKFKMMDQWEMMLMLMFIISSIFFFLVGIKFTVDQDHNIRKAHVCKDEVACDAALPWSLKWKIVRVNAVLAFFSFVTALIFSLSPTVTRAATH
jgi:hypothetical protein